MNAGPNTDDVFNFVRNFLETLHGRINGITLTLRPEASVPTRRRPPDNRTLKSFVSAHVRSSAQNTPIQTG